MVTDLNLLRVLDALLDTGSVTAAARRLHLSPPAVSRSLSRLRRILDDPLFVQVGRTFQPTPRALDLRTPTTEALAAAEAVLRTSEAEHPDRIRRTFTISADDALTAALAGALATALAGNAPGVGIRFITDDEHDTALDTGEADLDIGIAPGRAHLRSQPLFDDHYVLAAHPTSAVHHKRTLTTAFRDLTYVDIARNHSMRSVLAQHLPMPSRRVEVPSYLSAIHLLSADPRAVTVLPASLVARSAPSSVKARTIEFGLPTLSISQSWHVRNDNDTALAWLRDRIRELARVGDRRVRGRA